MVEANSSQDAINNLAKYLSQPGFSASDDMAIAIQTCFFNKYYRYKELSFDELNTLSDLAAEQLSQLGVKPGTRTILMVPPGIEFFVLAFALLKTGATTVMIDPGMGIKNLKDCIADVDASFFIGSLKAHIARKLLKWGSSSLKHFVMVSNNPLSRLFKSNHYNALMKKKACEHPFKLYNFQTSDLAAILFTSGSTGPPKGVEYTHAMFCAQQQILKEHYQVQQGERDLATFPGFALLAPALGIASVIPDMDASKPITARPENIFHAAKTYQCTSMFASPALIDKLGRFASQSSTDWKLPALKRVISAGAPARLNALKLFRKLLTDECLLLPSYGATESLPLTSIESRELFTTEAQTNSGQGICVGYPVAGMSIDIIPISDEEISQWQNQLSCKTHEIGEITVKGPIVSRHYFKKTKADTLSKIQVDDGNFYHRMGDLGYFDDTGRLWMCGRKHHRVQTSQGDLYTLPCERIFDTHPLVQRSALVGISKSGASHKTPVICIEPVRTLSHTEQQQVIEALSSLAKEQAITQDIETFLFHPGFPVDVRHNAKIVREKLADWANEQCMEKDL